MAPIIAATIEHLCDKPYSLPHSLLLLRTGVRNHILFYDSPFGLLYLKWKMDKAITDSMKVFLL